MVTIRKYSFHYYNYYVYWTMLRVCEKERPRSSFLPSSSPSSSAASDRDVVSCTSSRRRADPGTSPPLCTLALTISGTRWTSGWPRSPDRHVTICKTLLLVPRRAAVNSNNLRGYLFSGKTTNTRRKQEVKLCYFRFGPD